MAHYLFVPGGKRKGDDWDAVRALLEARGHHTDAITLSDPEHATLGGHIAEVCERLRAAENPVRLVGHSYASFVITGAANALPAKIEQLIYVDSSIPDSGQSLFDVFRAAGVDPAKFGVPAWPPFTEPLVFDPALLEPIPKLYIHCLRSQFLELAADILPRFKPLAGSDAWEYTPWRDRHWRYRELDSDHYCMLGNPEELAELILRS